MNLCDAVETGLPATVKIYNSNAPARVFNVGTEPVSVESRLSWFHKHYPKGHLIWVAEEGARSQAG